VVFSSIEFIFYFLPLALALFLPARNINLKYGIIVVLSALFLAFGDMLAAAVMALTLLTAMVIIQFRLRHFSLAVLLPLLLFKYNTAFGLLPENPMAGIALPLGISFYSFHIYSMVRDYWDGRFEFQHKGVLKFNPLKLAAYVSFFPQLIAGPILRYKDFHNQPLNHRRLELGATLFFLGLFKKAVIADSFALVADRVYATSPDILSAPHQWIGALAYHLQIFFDFCGYSEMAIGLGVMFAIRLPRNFKFPYSARSFTDFWRRWHITLSRFFRDYVYIPLGGNRAGGFNTYRNLLIVFLVTGAWHGNTANFIVWGLLHGGMLIAERLAPSSNRGAVGGFLASPVVRFFYVNILVMLFWVPFRAPTMEETVLRWQTMFTAPDLTKLGQIWDFVDPIHIVLLPIACLLAVPSWLTNFGRRNFLFTRTGTAVGIALFLVSLIFIVGRGYSPFIYFRF
jgi:alginate O-acetyltransferase complex protein AlgI